MGWFSNYLGLSLPRVPRHRKPARLLARLLSWLFFGQGPGLKRGRDGPGEEPDDRATVALKGVDGDSGPQAAVTAVRTAHDVAAVDEGSPAAAPNAPHTAEEGTGTPAAGARASPASASVPPRQQRAKYAYAKHMAKMGLGREPWRSQGW